MNKCTEQQGVLCLDDNSWALLEDKFQDQDGREEGTLACGMRSIWALALSPSLEVVKAVHVKLRVQRPCDKKDLKVKLQALLIVTKWIGILGLRASCGKCCRDGQRVRGT